ncbi:MAG: hypothetical protein Q4D96_07840 [Propionibacteriaceae bacterium]|nr:hypothetical protein [Propionibacteriaceae bacterium]
MKSFRRLAAAATAGLIAWAAVLPATAQDLELPDAGAAVTGVAWDGDTERLFAVSEAHGASILVTDSTGSKIGNLDFDARPESVQGLALHKGNLYVGDIGGNRKEIVVHRVKAAAGEQRHRSYQLSYPDGSHDAQALLVSGKGRIYVITAGDNPGIYHSELELSQDRPNKLTRAADAPPGVSDATFLTDGSTIVMRSAKGLEVVDAYTWTTTATASYVGAPEGESITTQGDGLLVGAQTLREEQVPKGDSERVIGAETSPSPDVVTPEPVPETPEETAGPGEPVVEEPKPVAPVFGGTRLALGAAAVLALGCGVVVLLRKD